MPPPPTEVLRRPTNTRADARRLFPHWNRHQQARWVLAKLRATKVHPHYGKILPLTADQIPKPDALFAPRTMREAM